MSPSPVVYVIDDDSDIRELVSIQLLAVGLSVETFDSAYAFLATEEFAERGCIVSDVRMPIMDGIELFEELNRRGVHLPRIIMTAHGDIPLAVRAMRAGARDVLEKPISHRSLLDRIQQVMSDSENSQFQRETNATSRGQIERLTPREREILELLILGRPSKIIASELAISMRTVDVHRANILKKLGVKTTIELLRLVLRSEQEF